MVDFKLTNGGKVIGVGTDLIDIHRIKEACENHEDRFIGRIFTDEEIYYCSSKRNPYPYYAVRFAAKEAVSKAFTTGISKYLDWKSIQVIKGDREEPWIRLDQKGKTLLSELGGKEVLISLSHTSSLAQAFAVIIA
jgi:holo-[acyl-carrier protein] synthase